MPDFSSFPPSSAIEFLVVVARIKKFEMINTCYPSNTAIAALPNLG
jgi:hypothetical protein